MANGHNLNVQHIINILEHQDCKYRAKWKKRKLYEIDPWDFLEYARQDLEDVSDRGRINALSNAKRAIECRVDEILTLINFRYFFSNRGGWGLPYKLQVLKMFGISAPDILLDHITRRRNDLEHRYEKPKQVEYITHITDIVELFLKASDYYIKRGHLASIEIIYPTASYDEKGSSKTLDTTVTHQDEYNILFDLEHDRLVIELQEIKEIQMWNKKTFTLSTRPQKIGDKTGKMEHDWNRLSAKSKLVQS